jgi:hypothetical protein
MIITSDTLLSHHGLFFNRGLDRSSHTKNDFEASQRMITVNSKGEGGEEDDDREVIKRKYGVWKKEKDTSAISTIIAATTTTTTTTAK